MAREHVVVGNLQDILRVCSEGLSLHLGNAELMRTPNAPANCSSIRASAPCART
ncbi:MAG: hypothetical protein R3F17_16930 [Planctomycetota bacterium]